MKNVITIYPKNQFNVDTGEFHIEASINHDAILKSVLYWDEIVIPNTDFVFTDISHEPWVKELSESGILTEPVLKVDANGSISEMMYKCHMNFISEMMRNQEHNFTAYNFENIFKKRTDLTNNSGGEIITLANALPIPSHRESIHNILEFKEKRKDELGQLMAHINSIEIEVASKENKDQALKDAVNRIDIACRDVIRLHKEEKIKFNLSNAKFNFSAKNISAHAGSAYAGASIIGMPQTAAVIAAFVAGISTTFEINDAISFKKIDRNNPFNYVGEMSIQLD